jgi:hypothetical protein
MFRKMDQERNGEGKRMMLSEGETIECNHCGKMIIVTKNEPESDTWVSVSYVTCDGEDPLDFFCSLECLEAWYKLTDQERFNLITDLELNEELRIAMKRANRKKKAKE